ncbi:MAG: ligand-gated channel protein, partial [Myxococcota bacterium]
PTARVFQSSASESSRSVGRFFRTWESVGLEAFRPTIPKQIVHGVSLTYQVFTGAGEFSASVELQNITNARVFDFFGVQRPGRSLFSTLTYQL